MYLKKAKTDLEFGMKVLLCKHFMQFFEFAQQYQKKKRGVPGSHLLDQWKALLELLA